MEFATTILVADCERGKRLRAWIFTAVLSRHRFVYPCFQETTGTVIQAREAASGFSLSDVLHGH